MDETSANDPRAHWKALAVSGNYVLLRKQTAQIGEQRWRIAAALWQALACRALEDGQAANAALLAAVHGRFEAGAEEAAALAEELLQCACFAAAAALIDRLTAAAAPQADYLLAILWREREDWAQCEAALSRTAAHGGQWPELARLQEAWMRMRQGKLGRAEELLAPFKGAAHPGVRKLLARLDLGCGRPAEAEKRLLAVAEAQPLDWEWPPLLAMARMQTAIAAFRAGDNLPVQAVEALFAKGLARQPRQAEALYQRARLRLATDNLAGAVADCNAALECKPWFDAPALLPVNQYVAVRDYDKAAALLEGVRQKLDTPKRAGAALDLQRLRGASQSEMVAVLNPLLEKFGRNVEFLRAAGAALQAVKSFDRAAALYEQALNLDPDDSATRNNLAMLYRDRGDHEEAVAAWRRLLEHGAVDDTVRLNMAHVLIERGDYAEAQALFGEVLARQPNHPSALRGLAEIHYAAGNAERAWEYARRSLKYDAANPLAWKTAAGVQSLRKGSAAAVALIEQGLAHARPVLALHKELFLRWGGIMTNSELRRRLAAWCAQAPEEVEYRLMLADAAMADNDFTACEEALQAAFGLDTDRGGAALLRFYQEVGRDGAARRAAEKMTRKEPENQRYWGLLAETLYRQKRYDEALAALERGLRIDPVRLALVRQQVGMLLARERYDEAVAAARRLVEAVPLPPQIGLLVEALQRAQRYAEAVEAVRVQLVPRPGDRGLRLVLASALRRAGCHREALDTLAALHADEPGNFAVVRSYVRALLYAEQHEKAIAAVRELSARSGERPDLLAAGVEILREQGELEAARTLAGEALAQHPGYLGLWQQAVQLEKRAGDAEAEAAHYREILDRFPPRRWAQFAIGDLVRLKLVDEMQDGLNAWRAAEPDNVAPWWAAFHAAQEMKGHQRAMEMLGKIEKISGPQVNVHTARAGLFSEKWEMSAAIAEQRHAIELRPNVPGLYEQLLNMLVKAGDFDEFDALMARLEHLMGDRRYLRFANFFFNINCHPSWSAEEVYRFYREWYQRAVRPGLRAPKAHINPIDPARRLRIGYVSPDFRRHAVAYFSEPLLVEHDREQFELFAYAHLDPGQADAYTERFKSYFHHWTEIRGMGDDELERRIRADGIDILVDLAGHTSNNRLKLFIRKPAPIQASWLWGAGQTTGLPEVDYLIGDACSLPAEFESCCAERVARLPEPGLPFKPAHDALEPVPLPCLERGFITFGVLARPLRTNRQTVALWAKILHRAPRAVLRFDHVPYAEPDVQQRLASYFAEHGIDAGRLMFCNTRPHWQVYREIDIQLDPFPAGSATTATEGLYMERLVVTLLSRPPMGRISDTQLAAMGLSALCSAATEDEYVDKAVALAGDIPRLAVLSAGLRERMKASSLMDYAAYGRDAARLYREMWMRYCTTR